MRPLELIREAVSTMRGRATPAVLIAVIVAVLCVVTDTTVGRTTATALEVAASIEQAGSRQLTIADVGDGRLLDRAVVDVTGSLSSVERAVGTTVAVDVVNGAVGSGGTPVPAWGVLGPIEDALVVVRGRPPGPGEAVVSERAAAALRLDEPVGYVQTDTRQWPVVGAFRARVPFDRLDAGVVYRPADDEVAQTLSVVLASGVDAARAQDDVLGVIGPSSTSGLQVSSPRALAGLEASVGGQLHRYSAGLLYGLLATGATLIAAIVTAQVLSARRDLGRRRALGATRTALLLLIVAQTALASAVGAVVGSLTALLLGGGTRPPATFVAGAAVLAVVTALAGAVVPAAGAARRDPVRVLRTP